MNTIPIQIRPSDHDSLGHVNNATYVAYVQHAVAELLAHYGFADDWRDGRSCGWTMRSLAIEYRLASSFCDRIAAHVWLAEPDEIQPLIGCEIFHEDEGVQQVAVRSRSRWSRQETKSGQAISLPLAFLETASQDDGTLPRPFKIPTVDEDLRRYQWRHTVERTEVGLGGLAHPHVLFQWIEESILCASADAGWPIERYLAADFIVFQMRHDTSFHSPPSLGEALQITSRLVNVRRLRGTWENEIRSLADGRRLATNYSTGVFLSLDGRPSSPPPGMIEALRKPIA